jgi:HEAT repeat protein
MRLLFAIAVLAASAIGCDGRDRLLASLQSVRPEARAAAIRKLADQAKPEDLVLFTRAAKDTAPVVRGEAASALGSSQDPRVVDVLGELLGDADESVQGKAAMALARIRTEQAKKYLTLQYARRGRSTRHAIVEALKSANVPGAMASAVAAESRTIWERNLQALTAGSLPERIAAAEELGKSGRVEAVNRLLPLINDAQVILAAAAVRGLGYTGDARAVEPIAELLTENFPELREAATDALVRLRDPKALPRLKEIALEKSAASAFATTAIIALPANAHTNAALCEIALEAAPEDARGAGRAMRTRGGCPLDPILERLARRAEQLAALYAIEGLGKVAARAAPKVIPLIASTDETLRLHAIAAAAEMGDAAAVEATRLVYEEELKRIEGLRADWIAGGLPREVAPGFDAGARASQELAPRELVEDVSEEQLRTFAGAIRALGQLRAPGALPLLEPHAKDPSPSVRAAALVGLARLGGAGIAAAGAGLSDPDREVRSTVALALAELGPDGQAALAHLLPQAAANRLPILSALDRAGPTPAVAEVLLSVLNEGGPESALAAHLLARVAPKEAVEPLLRQLDDPRSAARREALVALGRIGDPRAAEAVARDLYHDSPDVRAAAAEALAQLGTSPLLDALDALKGDYYRRVRESADAALAKILKPPEGRAQN